MSTYNLTGVTVRTATVALELGTQLRTRRLCSSDCLLRSFADLFLLLRQDGAFHNTEIVGG